VTYVKWNFVDDAVIGEQLKPFVEKKIVEYLRVQGADVGRCRGGAFEEERRAWGIGGVA